MPQATSCESLRHLFGVREYACMLKSAPVDLAAWKSGSKTSLVVLMCCVSLIAFFIPVLRLVILSMVSGLFGCVRLISGHVRRPPMGGSASSNVMSGGPLHPPPLLLPSQPFHCIQCPCVI